MSKSPCGLTSFFGKDVFSLENQPNGYQEGKEKDRSANEKWLKMHKSEHIENKSAKRGSKRKDDGKRPQDGTPVAIFIFDTIFMSPKKNYA